MSAIRFTVALFLSMVFCIAVASAQENARLEAGAEGPLEIPGCKADGVLYVPSDYAPGKRWPVIFFMHGSGGKPTSWPWKTATQGKGYLIAGLPYGAQEDLGANGILSGRKTCLAMVELIDKARAALDETYGIDQNQVILSGLSMGGWAVSFYGFLNEAKGRYAGYAILAAGPREGGTVDLSVAEGLPVLLLNGAKDRNLGAANSGKPKLEAAGAIVEQVILEGEGHVPSTESMAKPLAKWLGEVKQLTDRRHGLVAVDWRAFAVERATTRSMKPADLTAFFGPELARLKVEKGKPVLIYASSQAKGKKGKPSRSALACAKVEPDLFQFPTACDVPVASRRFDCLRWDLSRLDRKTSPQFHEGKAPLVILLDSDHQVVGVYTKNKLRPQPLLAAMKALLPDAEQVLVAEEVSELQPVLTDIAKIDKELAKVEKNLRKLRGAKRQSKKKIEAAEAKRQGLEADRSALQAKLAAK